MATTQQHTNNNKELLRYQIQ